MYYIIMIEENGKSFSYAEKIERSYNLATFINGRPWIKVMTPARSKKEAEDIAAVWNAAAEVDGRLLTCEEWNARP